MRLFLTNKTRLLKCFNGYTDKEVLLKIRKSLEYEIFGTYHHEKTIEQFEEFVFRTWGSNWAGNAFRAAGKYFKIFSAYLNKDLLPQLILQDRNERISGSIQKYIISRNSLYLTTVKLDITDIRHGAYVNDDIASKFKELQTIIPHYSRAAVNYFPKRLFKRHILKTPFLTDYPNWLRDYHGDYIKNTLNNNEMIIKNLIQKEKMDELIRSFLNGDDSQEQCVTRLLGLKLWLSKIYRNSAKDISLSVPSTNSTFMEYHEELKVGEQCDRYG
jgi:hypothetical protein